MVALAVAVAVFVFTRQAAGDQSAASLTIFTGSAQVERAGASAFVGAHTGDQLLQGDSVQTGPATRAGIAYPDGSLTRLDSNTSTTVKRLSRASGGGQAVELKQDYGKTWHKVVTLLGGASFKVDGPNSSTAEVRGTVFSVIIEKNSAGQTVIRFDSWQGSIAVLANGQTVSLTAGQSSTVAPGAGPTAPSAIPAGDLTDPFTVFNQTADTSIGQPTTLNSNTLNQGQSTSVQVGPTADGNTDYDFALGWPGSTFELTVIDPDGNVYQVVASASPPIHIEVSGARPGVWSYRVRDIESSSNEVWWVIVSKTNPSTKPADVFFTTPTPCDHTVTAGQTTNWNVAARSSAQRPALSAAGLPSFSSFSDHGDGSATLTFSPLAGESSADIPITVTATSGAGTASLGCLLHVRALAKRSTISGHVAGYGAGVSVAVSPGSLSALTDAAGTYEFTDLGAGTYGVAILVPAGYAAIGPTSRTVTVDGVNSASADFELAARPAVASISPSLGAPAGGTSVVIAGIGFSEPIAVAFGSVPAASYHLDSATQITAVSPAQPGGLTVDVSVVTQLGTSPASSGDRFRYVVALRVTSSADRTAVGPGGLVSLTAVITGGASPYAVVWDFGDGATGSLAVDAHRYAAAGRYLAIVTVRDDVGEAAGATAITVNVAALTVSVQAGKPEGPAPLTTSLTAMAAGGAPPYTYAWQFGDGSTGTNSASQSHTYTNPGVYTAAATITDSDGSSQTSSTTVTVASLTTTTAVTVSPSPSVFGQVVTVRVTVSSAGGTPTGTVDLSDSIQGTLATGVTLSAGNASFTTGAESVGGHTITASYPATGSYAASTGTAGLTVNQGTTTTALSSDANPAASGATVHFTATVSATSPAAGTPTGSVTFLDGGSSIGSAPVIGGSATLAYSALSAGSHAMTAGYGGDTNFTASSSSTLNQGVNNGIAQVVLGATPAIIAADGTSTSLILARALDSTGAPLAAASPITVSLTTSDATICTLTTAATTIAAGQTDSSASPGKITSTATAGGCSIGGTATGGFSGPATAVTVTTTHNQISLPAEVLVGPGTSVNFGFTISPAPSSSLVVSFSTLAPAVATVSSSVTVPAGQTGGTATLSGVANGQTTLTASAPSYATASTLATVKVITIGFSVGSVSVPATWTDSSAQVRLSDAAPAGGLVVGLTVLNTSFASVSPASVVVPAGQLTSPTFTVTGVAQGNTSISAAATGATAGSLPIYVGPKPTLTLYYDGSSVAAGMHRGGFWVNLSNPASGSGLTINLTSSDATVAAVTPSINIQGGQSGGSYTITGLKAGSVTVSATAAGWTSSQITINVVTPGLQLNAVATSRTTLDGPNNFNVLTFTPNCGTCDYWNADTAITLTVNGTPSNIVTINGLASPVTVTALANTYYLNLTADTPSAAGTYTITASASGVTSFTSATVNVTQPVLTLYYDGSSVAAGMHRTGFWVNLSNPAPTGGLVITLGSTDPTIATVPATITIGATSSGGSYAITGLKIGQVRVTASAIGWSSSTITINITQPALQLNGLSVSRTSLDGPNSFTVTTVTPGCGTCDYWNADTAVTLAVNGNPSNIITLNGMASPVTVTALANTYYLTVTADTPSAAGTYTISATATGYTAFTSGTVTVTLPALTLYYDGSWVAAGMHRGGFWVNLSNPAPQGGMTVNLTNSDPTLATTTQSINLLAGQSGGSYTITGLKAGSVKVTASAAGWTSSQITINVVTPALQLSGVSANRTTLDGSNTFSVTTVTPNCGTCDYWNADTSVTLTVNGTPANIITINGAASPVTLTALANSYYLNASADTPTAAGTYTITATATGFTTFTSGTVTVTQPALTLYYDGSWVGAGMHRDDFWVNLSNPAQANGLVVNLGSTDPTIASVPSTITIGAGNGGGGYRVTGLKPGSVTITAAAAGWTSSKITINVATPSLQINSLATPRTTLDGPNNFTVTTVTPNCGTCDYWNLDTPITLRVNGAPPNIVTLNGSASPVTVTGLANTFYTSVNADKPSAPGTYTITATATEFTTFTSGTVTVTLPNLNLYYDNSWVSAGMHRSGFWINLSNPTPSALTVTLTTSDGTLATVTPSVTVSASASGGAYAITGLKPGTVKITASASGWTPSTITVNVTAPTFIFNGLQTNRAVNGAANAFTVTAYTPNCGACDTVNADVTVTFSVVSTPAGIETVTPTTATILADTAGSASAKADPPSAAGTYNIVAKATGFTDGVSPSVTVT